MAVRLNRSPPWPKTAHSFPEHHVPEFRKNIPQGCRRMGEVMITQTPLKDNTVQPSRNLGMVLSAEAIFLVSSTKE